MGSLKIYSLTHDKQTPRILNMRQLFSGIAIFFGYPALEIKHLSQSVSKLARELTSLRKDPILRLLDLDDKVTAVVTTNNKICNVVVAESVLRDNFCGQGVEENWMFL